MLALPVCARVDHFLGGISVLRPRDDAAFVSGDNAHTMLPDEPGLYLLTEPEDGPSDSGIWPDSTSASGPYVAPNTDSHAAAGSKPRAVNGGLQAALLQFMNNPHPLQSLSLYESYGPNGAISRFHNPNNYTVGLDGLRELLRKERGGSSSSGDEHLPPTQQQRRAQQPRRAGRLAAR